MAEIGVGVPKRKDDYVGIVGTDGEIVPPENMDPKEKGKNTIEPLYEMVSRNAKLHWNNLSKKATAKNKVNSSADTTYFADYTDLKHQIFRSMVERPPVFADFVLAKRASQKKEFKEKKTEEIAHEEKILENIEEGCETGENVEEGNESCQQQSKPAQNPDEPSDSESTSSELPSIKMAAEGEQAKPGMLFKQKSMEINPSLPHQESFHQLTELERPWGIVKIDTNRRTETFKSILKNSLYGHGDIFHAVCMLDGATTKVLANYPEEFLPSAVQIAILESAKMNPGPLAAQGIKLADMDYTYARSEQSGGGRTSVYNLYGTYTGEDGKGGVMIFPTKNYLVCGLYRAVPEDCGTKLENLKFKANELIEDVTDWLSSTGM